MSTLRYNPKGQLQMIDGKIKTVTVMFLPLIILQQDRVGMVGGGR